MSGAVINLNHARKQRKKVDETITAAANRARFGRSKLTKQQDAASQARDARMLDAHRLDQKDAES